MTWICQKELPEDMRVLRNLPGIQPLDMANWLHVDEVYDAQMRERCRLLSEQPADVLARTSGSKAAVQEALDLVMTQLSSMNNFKIDAGEVRCPDGRIVALTGDPLCIMGQLIQEDICVMQKPSGNDEHILSAAVLCFPAHWTLSEKIGRTLGRIHVPVDVYTEDIARRVQRLFDGVKEGRALWRFNRAYAGPQLYQPRAEADYKHESAENAQEYLRAERQSLVRLPKSGAVLFSIHTYVVAQTAKQF